MPGIRQPYTPGNGTRPSPFVGRTELQASIRELLASSEHLPGNALIVGQRGLGKTALAKELADDVREDDWFPALRTLGPGADDPRQFILTFNQLARETMQAASRLSALTDMFTRVEIEIRLAEGVNIAFGLNDSPGELTLEDALYGALRRLIDATQRTRRGRGLFLILDEAHHLADSAVSPGNPLGALVGAVARAQSEAGPVTLALVGLPPLQESLALAAPDAASSLAVHTLQAFEEAEAMEALVKPFVRVGMHYEDAAAAQVIEDCQGIPALIQEFGSSIYRKAVTQGTLTIDAAFYDEIRPAVVSACDERLFIPHFAFLSAPAQACLRAAADMGSDTFHTSDIQGPSPDATLDDLQTRGVIYRLGDGLGFSAAGMQRFISERA